MILWSESFDVTNQFSPDTKNFLKNHTTYLVLAIEYSMNFYIINNWHNLRLTLILQTWNIEILKSLSENMNEDRSMTSSSPFLPDTLINISAG